MGFAVEQVSSYDENADLAGDNKNNNDNDNNDNLLRRKLLSIHVVFRDDL